MKKSFIHFTILLFSIVVLSSCNKTEIPDPFPSEEIEGCYIVNYGNWGSGGASISKYDYYSEEVTNFYFQAQNGGSEIFSNIQYGYEYKDSVFLVGNVADQLITVNPLFKQTVNGVSNDLETPRFCVATEDYLYISCWGTNSDHSASYIAKYNIVTRGVETKIMVPGGPEGLEIANGKLYAALNYKDSVAVINLSNEQVSYIVTPAVTSYFVKDNSDNLYVTLISTWSDFSEDTGIGYINTVSDQLEEIYILENVNNGYGSMIQANADFSKIYLVTAITDANWNITGAVAEFNVAKKSFNTENLISDISGISGLAVNPKNDNIYVFSAQSTTGVGMMQIYSETGEYKKEYEVGAFPVGAFFLD